MMTLSDERRWAIRVGPLGVGVAVYVGLLLLGGVVGLPWGRWVWDGVAAFEGRVGVALPPWVWLLGVGFAPWAIAGVSLLRGRWRLALSQSVSLGLGYSVGVALFLGWWFLVEAKRFQNPVEHPFPQSISKAAAAGVHCAVPLDPNDWGLQGQKPPSPPPESGWLKRGETEVVLWNGRQGGMFEAWIWANPGEAGELHVRVVEYTTLQPVSEDSQVARRNIREATRHEARFSKDPGEVFFSQTAFTVHGRGGWQHFFAGRVELWFRPASGGPERRLWERVFRLNFWER